jgi:hypothetical protein
MAEKQTARYLSWEYWFLAYGPVEFKYNVA